MAILLVIVLSGSTLIWNGIPVYASMADEAIEYMMGETYRGTYSKGEIAALKSKTSGQMTVSCQSVKNAIGYKIQYSTDYYKKGVKTVYSPTTVKTLTKLNRGKRYYVKVMPYTVYSDGVYAWGRTSYVKSAVENK